MLWFWLILYALSQTSCFVIFETTIAQSCLQYIMIAVTTSDLAYSHNCLKQSKAGVWCQCNASISSNYQGQSCLGGVCAYTMRIGTWVRGALKMSSSKLGIKKWREKTEFVQQVKRHVQHGWGNTFSNIYTTTETWIAWRKLLEPLMTGHLKNTYSGLNRVMAFCEGCLLWHSYVSEEWS